MSKNDDDLKFVFPENVDKDYTVWMVGTENVEFFSLIFFADGVQN